MGEGFPPGENVGELSYCQNFNTRKKMVIKE